MLFQRLFNWIKYKTLPSSMLFKNRLFIERDSKHRRIFNNFGLTFRNSKWSNYEMYNVKFNFQWSYYKYFFFFPLFAAIFLILIGYTNYYLYSPLLSSVSFFFWTGIDAFDYYSSFIIWFGFVSCAIVVDLTNAYLLKAIYGDTRTAKEAFLNPFFLQMRLVETLEPRYKILTHASQNKLVYSWLLHSTGPQHLLALETVFDSKINKVWWEKYHSLFISLFKATHLCSLSSEKNTAYSVYYKLQEVLEPYKFVQSALLTEHLQNSQLLNKFTPLILWHKFSSTITYFEANQEKSTSLRHLNLNSEWNFGAFKTNNFTDQTVLNAKVGSFLSNSNYANLYNFGTNFKETWAIFQSINDQLSLAKNERWLYKYSILHRKILKNSHKLTSAKRLLSSGYFSQTLFDKNIWASVYFNKSSKLSTHINNTSYLFYNNLNFYVQQPDFISWKSELRIFSDNKKLFQLLNFYETSYFWYIKRYFNFNSFESNFFAVLPKINPSLNDIVDQSNPFHYVNYRSSYHYLFGSILKSRRTNLHAFYLDDYKLNLQNLENQALPVELNPINDFYLLNEENELLTHDNLKLLAFIASSPVGCNRSLPLHTSLELVLLPKSLLKLKKFSSPIIDNTKHATYSDFQKLNSKLDNLFSKDLYFYVQLVSRL